MPLITITQGIGGEGLKIAERVAEGLNIKRYDDAELIINAADSEEIRTCSIYALDAMERLSLEKQIHAALLKNNIDAVTINIEVPEKGVAHISGLAGNLDDKQRIEKAAKSVPGITTVKLEVSFRTAAI